MVETVLLREVARIDRNSIAPADIETGSKYVGLENIESGGRLINVGTVANGELASSKFQFTSEHVLYGKLRPYLAKIALPEFDGICSTDILPVLPGPKLDRRFLVHYLRQPKKVRLANSLATGANLPRLNPSALGEMAVPLPPLNEQRRIAAILDKADELRAKRRQAVAHLDALTQSIFHSIFGDLTNERQIPLRDAVAPGTIVTYGIVQAGDEYPSGVPYVRTGDMRDGRIDHEGLRRTDPAVAAKFARSRIAAGDIVMSIRATVGTVALTPQELDGANLTQGTARIAPGLETEASYLLEYLRTPRVQQWIQKQVKGATFKEITLDRLRQLPVSIPRKADQLSFGHAVGAVEKLKGKHQAHLSDLEILFASLQHRAFRGEL